MMTRNLPLVSVGMPVYNAGRFIAQAIESILSQTFENFELIISDNGSTDATEEICRGYAAKDARVRYYRNEQNRGAAWNHNRVVELARGEYFRWQCHDDYCSPTLLEKCLRVLQSDRGVIMCYPRFVRVDEQGKQLGVKSSRVRGEADTAERFRSLIYRRDSCEEIYGVTRTAVIRKTALIGAYSNSDDTFLAELILHGRFSEVPEPLFFYRIHKTQSTSAYPSRYDRMSWFKPLAGFHFTSPFLRLFVGYVALIWRSPLGWRDKVRCYLLLVGWFWHFKRWLAEDVRTIRSSLIHRCLAPWCTQHAAWARPIWQKLKALKNRMRRPESARAREKRTRREKEEQWELGAEE
jgi:glycosyltransferase involved in cell wall biosynthesis